MRTFVALVLLAVAAFWTGRRLPTSGLALRIVRKLLFVTSGVVGALLVSAALQSLFD